MENGLRAEGRALTATDGAAPRETGCAEGTMEGAAKDGVNDNNEEGVAAKTGIPAGEELKLAPAAPAAEDAAEGTETRTG